MPKSARPYNFSAGPAALPEEVLQRASAEMLDWHGSGMGVMEMSHRGREFGEILAQAQSDLRSLLALPASHHILFMQGGGLAENAIVPLNLSQGRSVDFVITGAWSTKSQQEAQRYCDSRIAYSAEDNGFTSISNPNTWDLSKSPAYVHLCSNETIHGLEFAQLPDLQALGVDAPLVIDCSSHILSRSFAWDKIGLAFAGAQKNIGPAGLTLVIVREDLLDKALPMCPSAFCYGLVAKNASMYNTPPTYAIYIAGLVFQWLQAQGGVAAIEAQNQAKAQLLYAYIDASERYQNRVQPDFRSRMNVPFYLLDDAGNAVVSSQHPLNQAFLQGASARGLLQLKGHVSVGGLRASIYNAMPLAGVQALVNYMQEFEQSL